MTDSNAPAEVTPELSDEELAEVVAGKISDAQRSRNTQWKIDKIDGFNITPRRRS
jgi:hypothetical protein